MNDKVGSDFFRLLEIMKILRSPAGCPWDAAQTPDSLKPYLLEETYEVLEAIDAADPAALCEELGDLLLQIVFQARIFEERRAFDMNDVARAIADKLVRRHPHVFAGAETGEPEELHRQWDLIKAAEKKDRGERDGMFAGIPRQLPALQRAGKVVEKVRRAGIGPKAEEIFTRSAKLLAELQMMTGTSEREAVQKKLGELLFDLAALARLSGVDPEESLRLEIDRFILDAVSCEGKTRPNKTLSEEEAKGAGFPDRRKT